MKELFQFFRSGLTYAWDNSKIVAYIALIILPIILISGSNLINYLQFFPLALASFLIFVVAFRLIIAGGVSGIVNQSIPHQPMKITNLFHYGTKYFIRLLGLSIVYFCSILLIGILLFPFHNMINNSSLVLSIAIAIITTMAYYLIPIFLLSYFAVICEERGVIASIRRGYQLCGQNYTRLKIFGLIVLYLLTFVLIGAGLGLSLAVIFNYYLDNESYIADSFLTAFIGSFGMVGFSSIFIPFFRTLAVKAPVEDSNIPSP